MSTNYFIRQKSLNDNADFENLHLGKRSGGRKFQWCANIIEENCATMENGSVIIRHKYRCRYPLTKQGITNFIMQENLEVVDEYGDIQNKHEFLEMAFNWCSKGLLPSDETDTYFWDYSSYQEKFKQLGKFGQLGIEFKSPADYSFINDGLVWIIFDDFM